MFNLKVQIRLYNPTFFRNLSSLVTLSSLYPSISYNDEVLAIWEGQLVFETDPAIVRAFIKSLPNKYMDNLTLHKSMSI